MNFYEVFVTNKYVICPNCDIFTTFKFKVIRIISLRDTRDIIDHTRLKKYIQRRGFLHDIVSTVLASRANWTRERTLRKDHFSVSQLQNSLWGLYNIGLIKIKCTLTNSYWKIRKYFSLDDENEVDRNILNKNAFIYSITPTNMCTVIFKETLVESPFNFNLLKQSIKNLITTFLQDNVETPIDNRSILIRSKLKDLVVLLNELPDNQFFDYFGLVKQPNILLEFIKFLMEMNRLVDNGNIMFTQELVESAKISPENRSKYRMLSKKFLNYPLIIFNTFRNRIYGESNIIISSEIFQLIIFLEENLRELIVKKLSQKTWNSPFHLWKMLPESVKMGSASQRTFNKRKMPKKEHEQELLISTEFNDPIDCLRTILSNSYFSDLGNLVSHDPIYEEFFSEIFTDLKTLKRVFKNLTLLRNNIMHSHVPSDDFISLGLSGGFEVLTGLYTSNPNLILSPI